MMHWGNEAVKVLLIPSSTHNLKKNQLPSFLLRRSKPN